MMKKILKYLLLTLSTILLLCLLVFAIIFIRYKSIVNARQNGLITNYQPGGFGSQVNPFIGTGGYFLTCAMNFPGVAVPFGMVRLSPDTKSFMGNYVALNSSGYYYPDNKILGFSHTRLSGTGAWDGGHFRVLPLTTTISNNMLSDGLEATFSHANERAFPGYYAVKLKKSKILVELTATSRTGYHRYTFPEKGQKNLYLDLSSTLQDKKADGGYVRVLPGNQEIEGHIRTYGSFAKRYGGVKVYFVAQLNHAFTDFSLSANKAFLPGLSSLEGDQLGIRLSFNESESPVELKLAISYVSIENARLNLEAETGGKSFDQIVEAAKAAWEDKLSLIQIEGATEQQKQIYYTALYRAFTMPTVFNDVNGQYFGFDQAVHQTDSSTYYTDLSLWDTFRNLHSLYTLIAKKEQRDMMHSLVRMSEQGGYLPRWPAGNGYSNSMLGTPADIAIAEAYLKGIRGFDIQKAYEAMKKTALALPSEDSGFSGRRGIESYLKYGYCAAEEMSQAVSRTMEYAWADDAISRLADTLGYTADAQLFKKHSRFYKNVWNPGTQYFQARNSDGQFVEKFDPLQLTYTDWDREFTDDYVEGSALQWRYAIPFDAEGLIGLFKSKDYFIQELNTFFEKSNARLGHWHPGSYYWHGNEPDIYAPYLFNEAGRPDLTQKWVRWVLDHKYGTSPTGLDGNDDGATLSAYYLFSALGFYPQAGSDIYQIGTPLFKAASVNMGTGVLEIKAKNFSPQNQYIKKVWLNGQLLNRWYFKHEEIAGGGVLLFEMQSSPE